MTLETGVHIPVMLEEVLALMAPQTGGLYVDGTFGGGGYTRGMLGEADCRVVGIDRDGAALSHAAPMVKAYNGRLILKHGRYAAMETLCAEEKIEAADGVVLDLGVSSIQLDDPDRGFSFLHDGPLDMRMGGESEPDSPSAADLVNTLSESELRRILFRYGEERRAGTVARAIVERRGEAAFERTLELASLVERVLGATPRGEAHAATRTFQALRIAVNGELVDLALALSAAERLLAPGGRLVIVSFHSLEDRIVKTFLTHRCGNAPQGSRHAPPVPVEDKPSFRLLVKGVRTPGEAEVAANPRSRSAKLRAAQRTTAPAWAEDLSQLGIEEEDRR